MQFSLFSYTFSTFSEKGRHRFYMVITVVLSHWDALGGVWGGVRVRLVNILAPWDTLGELFVRPWAHLMRLWWPLRSTWESLGRTLDEKVRKSVKKGWGPSLKVITISPPLGLSPSLTPQRGPKLNLQLSHARVLCGICCLRILYVYIYI